MSTRTKFSDHFWDENVSGYMLLYQNLRNSRQTVKELECFLRDTAGSQEQYAKQLTRVSQSVGKFKMESSAAPLWLGVLKEISEQNNVSHAKFAIKLAELIKQVQSYGEQLRIQKNKFKQSDINTVQLIDQFRSAKTHLQRAKESYVHTANELEKQKKIHEQTQSAQNSTSNQQQVLKLEKKLATQTGVYQSCIEKYNSLIDELELKFSSSCDQFEQMERFHLDKMTFFLSEYLKLVDGLNTATSLNLTDSQHKLSTFTTEHLIEQFLLNKSIGQNRPARAEFLSFDAMTPTPEKTESKRSIFLNFELFSKIKSAKKTRTSSANAIDVSQIGLMSNSTDTEPARLAKTLSLDSVDFHVSSRKSESDLVNFYEPDENFQSAKDWMRSSDSSDTDSDDSDKPKKIYLRINPVETKCQTSPDQLNKIGKNLQLKINLPEKKVYSKSYKIDENNNVSEQPTPPPLPPLPLNLQIRMNQRVSELCRAQNESPCTLNKTLTDSDNDEQDVQF